MRRRAPRQHHVDENGVTCWWFSHPDPVARFTGWVALFTLLLAIVGGFQTFAFVQSERASLGVSSIGLTTQTLVPDQPITIRIGMRNGGRSTADIVDANVILNVSPALPEKVDYVKGNALLAGTSILPGTDIYSAFRPKREQQLFSLTAGQIADIRASKAIFSVHGFLAYKDDFSIFGPKVTRFCVWFNPLNDATIGPFDNCGPGTQ